MLIDIVGIDYPLKRNRFEIVYNLLSIFYNTRMLLSVVTHEYPKSFIPSIQHLFPNAVWYEREIWDMFGIYFIKNNDMRRILNDYAFEGHPLRKDFPVVGYSELNYSFGEKRVVKNFVSLSQMFRVYKFDNNWGYISK